MKVVDEKGKLFGKLNIIDLLVLIFILAAIIVVSVKFLGGGNNGGKNSGEGSDAAAELGAAKLTYTVRVSAQRPEFAEQISEYVDITTGKRDQLVAGGDLVENAYIVDFRTEPAQYNKLTDGSMEFYDTDAGENGGLVDLCFVIEAEIPDSLTSTVVNQEIRIGRSNIVKTIHMEFTGMIEKCTWNPVE